MISIDDTVLSSEVAHLLNCQNVSGWKQWQLWEKTMWLGMEEKPLNERRHFDVINPGAKSTSSPSAPGKNTKGREGCLHLFCFFSCSEVFIAGEAVKNSSLMLQMERWKSEKRALRGERRLSRLIVWASDTQCITTHGAVSVDFMPAESLLLAAVRKWTVYKMKTRENLNPEFFFNSDRKLSTLERASVIRSSCIC